MTIGLYMDVHVPAAITVGLRLLNIDVLTARDDGYDQVTDEQLLERATALGRMLVTHDEDLLAITHAWLVQGKRFAGVVYGHQLRLTVGQAVHDLELIAKASEPADVTNIVLFIPL